MSFSNIVNIIIQSLSESIAPIQVVLAMVVIWSALWAYRVFGFKEKVDELKQLKKEIEEYFLNLNFFCIMPKHEPLKHNEEFERSRELLKTHNDLYLYFKTVSFPKKRIRKKIEKIGISWLENNHKLLERYTDLKKKPEEVRAEDKDWQKFEADYNKLMKVIDKQI